MAELGARPHRSVDIGEQLGRTTSSLGSTRAGPSAKGMIWGRTHSDTADLALGLQLLVQDIGAFESLFGYSKDARIVLAHRALGYEIEL